MARPRTSGPLSPQTIYSYRSHLKQLRERLRGEVVGSPNYLYYEGMIKDYEERLGEDIIPRSVRALQFLEESERVNRENDKLLDDLEALLKKEDSEKEDSPPSGS